MIGSVAVVTSSSSGRGIHGATGIVLLLLLPVVLGKRVGAGKVGPLLGRKVVGISLGLDVGVGEVGLLVMGR